MSTKPQFAVTGRGNDVKRARDLIASIGGSLTTKDNEADYLVVVKGAGRRKVEDYYYQNFKRINNNNNDNSGRLLLLDMLEEWSQSGAPPKRRISVEDLILLNIFGANNSNSLESSRRSYVVPEGFLKRSRVTLDAQGNKVDESDNAVLLASQKKTIPSHSQPPPPPLLSFASPITPIPMNKSTITSRNNSRMNNAQVQSNTWQRAILLDDDSPPQKPINDIKKNNIISDKTVVNPMRAAFQQRKKPDWETYFDDVPNSSTINNNNNFISNREHSHKRDIDVTPPNSSLSFRVSTNKPCPSDKEEITKGITSDVTKQKKNSIELTFNFTKNDSSNRQKDIQRNTNNINQQNDTQNKVNLKNNNNGVKVTENNNNNNTLVSHASTGEISNIDRYNTRQTKVNHDDETIKKVGSVSRRRDRTFGTPPPLPPRPSTANSKITTSGERKTNSVISRITKPSSSSNVNYSGNVASTSSNRTSNSDSLLQRVRKSSYCKGIPEETCISVLQQVVDRACPVSFNGIAGLRECKRILQEAIILPAKCPQLFTGLRRPCSGLLLFGPPGNGKTLLASAIAKECQTTFFSISAAAITSKWVGEGEKMVRALFAVARALAPSTIFVDEIDALLQARGGHNEGEGSRRIKTEFLVQMDGAGNDYGEARVLVMGATNRPFDLDEAIIRRFPKRVFVPLPDSPAREQILQSLLNTEETPNNITPRQWQRIVESTEGYSGHDLRQLCEEAAMIPVRELLAEKLKSGEDLTNQAYHHSLLRPLTLQDVEICVKERHPSCCPKQLKALQEWSDTYGCK